MDTVKNNSVGAIVFFSYIVAALFFTGIIVRDLLSLYNASQNVRDVKARRSNINIAKNRRRGGTFVILSVISFTSLSYHMLRFLIESYSLWGQASGNPLPTGLWGTQGIFDFHRQQTPLHLWQWATQSTLFQTFAESLVNSAERFWWTHQALVYSLGWNIFMAIEGTRYRIPHLWTYYVLDQILPISFTQNLFCAAILFSSNLPQAITLKPCNKLYQVSVVAIYLLQLATVPTLVGRPVFFTVLFGIRFLLFASYWVLRPTAHKPRGSVQGSGISLYSEYKLSMLILAFGSVCMNLLQLQRISSTIEAVKAINDNPAVSALGYDYLAGAISLIYFVALQLL